MERSVDKIIMQFGLFGNEIGLEVIQFSIQQEYNLKNARRHKVQATYFVLILS